MISGRSLKTVSILCECVCVCVCVCVRASAKTLHVYAYENVYVPDTNNLNDFILVV